MQRHATLGVLFSFSIVTLSSAGEMTTNWAGKSPAHSRIILESAQFESGAVNRAGVQLKLDDGWWTYWRAPGTSGIPPVFDWSGSTNLSDAPELSWPVPVRAVAYGEQLNLYHKEVVFPVEFRAADPTKPVTLKLKLNYGACKNMCVPATAEHEIMINPTMTGARNFSSANARLISSYSGRRPSSDPVASGLEIREVWEYVSRGKVNIGIRLAGLGKGRRPLVLVEGPEIFQAAEIIPKLTAERHTSTLMIALGKSAYVRKLSGKRLRITVIDGSRALEQIWVVGTQSSSAVGMGLTPVSSGAGDKPEP